jgi:hypothetical protein
VARGDVEPSGVAQGDQATIGDGHGPRRAWQRRPRVVRRHVEAAGRRAERTEAGGAERRRSEAAGQQVDQVGGRGTSRWRQRAVVQK